MNLWILLGAITAGIASVTIILWLFDKLEDTDETIDDF